MPEIIYNPDPVQTDRSVTQTSAGLMRSDTGYWNLDQSKEKEFLLYPVFRNWYPASGYSLQENFIHYFDKNF
jgi:hypothetical protein